jgi:hypothetical protein
MVANCSSGESSASSRSASIVLCGACCSGVRCIVLYLWYSLVVRCRMGGLYAEFDILDIPHLTRERLSRPVSKGVAVCRTPKG